MWWLLLACTEPAPKPQAARPPPRPRPAFQTTGQSGGALQDPSGFPVFHDFAAPRGAGIAALGDWSAPVKLSETEGGGYRPQVTVGPNDLLHAIYYERTKVGDLIRHRTSTDGLSWTAPVPLGLDKDRNWGPDLVAREDGSMVVVFDHALPDFRSRGYLTFWRNNAWTPPEPLTDDDGGEIGSGHVAHGVGDQLAYVFIGKALGPEHHFAAQWRWFKDGVWSEKASFTDGKQDAWHTNVERRPDGSVLAGFDVGTGGSETALYVADGRDGAFSPMENLTLDGKPGERPHFAFGGDGVDHVTWFHKEAGHPLHVYVRSGRPGAWNGVEEPSKGYGGFHFDPEIEINKDGIRCLVWGWDAGSQAEMVYSLDRGQGWAPPKRIATIGAGKPGLASLVTDSTGAFDVVWNQGVRGKNDVYFARLKLDP